MFPSILYILTGLITALPIWLLGGISTPVVGIVVLAPISLIGSLILLSAAIICLVQIRLAAWIALIGTLFAWPFYGGTIYVLLFERRVFDDGFLIFLTPLAISTIYAATVCFDIGGHFLRASWFFPESPARSRMYVVATWCLALVPLGLSIPFAQLIVMLIRPEPEVYLIPAKYIGEVYIIYNMQDGATPRYEDGNIVFEIPGSGVFKSKVPPRTGWRRSTYLYITPEGKRRKITARWDSTIQDTPENRAETSTVGISVAKTGIYMHTTGSATGIGSSCKVLFTEYFVGTKADLLSYKRKTIDDMMTDNRVCSQ